MLKQRFPYYYVCINLCMCNLALTSTIWSACIYTCSNRRVSIFQKRHTSSPFPALSIPLHIHFLNNILHIQLVCTVSSAWYQLLMKQLSPLGALVFSRNYISWIWYYFSVYMSRLTWLLELLLNYFFNVHCTLWLYPAPVNSFSIWKHKSS